MERLLDLERSLRGIRSTLLELMPKAGALMGEVGPLAQAYDILFLLEGRVLTERISVDQVAADNATIYPGR